MDDPGAVARAASAGPVRRTQAQRTAHTRARLIEAAIQALVHGGYAATSTVIVAQQAGVPRGAMLHHFASKAELMAAVVQATYEADLAVYEEVLARPSATADRIVAVIACAADRFRAPGGIAQTELWNASRSDPELAGAVMPLLTELDGATRAVFRHWYARATGRSDLNRVDGLHALVLAFLRGLSLSAAARPDPAREDQAVAMLLDHIRIVLGPPAALAAPAGQDRPSSDQRAR